MNPLYLLNDVCVIREGKAVLRIDRLSIREGGVHVLTGANGAGKSTLLSLLAFLEPPAAGQVSFRGEQVRWSRGEPASLRRQVTLVHQVPFLFHGTVADNVAYGLRVRGVRGREGRRQVERVLETAGLAGFGTREVAGLSGGEARRVAMARALVLAPAVLLLDEPLANLDLASGALLERLIVGLSGQGTTVIISTHETRHAARLGGEEIRLEMGRLAAESDPADGGADQPRESGGALEALPVPEGLNPRAGDWGRPPLI